VFFRTGPAWVFATKRVKFWSHCNLFNGCPIKRGIWQLFLCFCYLKWLKEFLVLLPVDDCTEGFFTLAKLIPQNMKRASWLSWEAWCKQNDCLYLFQTKYRHVTLVDILSVILRHDIVSLNNANAKSYDQL